MMETAQAEMKCGGCGAVAAIEESLCPACSSQLLGGAMPWTDYVPTIQEATK